MIFSALPKAPDSVLHYPPQAGSHGCRRWVFRQNPVQLIRAVHHVIHIQIHIRPSPLTTAPSSTTPNPDGLKPISLSVISCRRQQASAHIRQLLPLSSEPAATASRSARHQTAASARHAQIQPSSSLFHELTNPPPFPKSILDLASMVTRAPSHGTHLSAHHQPKPASAPQIPVGNRMSTFDFDYSGAWHHITDRRCRAEDPTKRKQLVGVSIPSSRSTVPKGQQAMIPIDSHPSRPQPRSSRPSHLPSITPKLPPIRPWPACVASFHRPFPPSFQIRTHRSRTAAFH
ncbi:hypothetical protein ACLOJK_022848, partial [Asimina triloba]